jgi:hypothetical protein
MLFKLNNIAVFVSQYKHYILYIIISIVSRFINNRLVASEIKPTCILIQKGNL